MNDILVHTITRQQGIAGQYSYAAEITHPGEPRTTVSFVGDIYGSPIIMVTPSNPRGVFVRNPERFGDTLNESWVRAFLGTAS